MLIGNYTNKVSSKGRTAVPAQFRKKLGQIAIITKGYEGSLFLVSMKNWQQVTDQVDQDSFILAQTRKVDRFILGNAFEIKLDSQGRFVIPKNLREFAQVGPEAIFVGVGNRVEIWDKSRWQKHQDYLGQNVEKIIDSLS